MSSNPDPKLQRRKKIAPAESDTPNRRAAAGQYEVGYGKPPVATRFVKGQSGNPNGRPRKPKPRPPRLSDAPSDRYLEEEAYRLVTLRENGREIELPMLQAVVRSLAMEAVKGKRLSQKYFLEYVVRLEELHMRRELQNYLRLETLKRNGEEVLAQCARRGLPPPNLLPHPEDIVLRPSTGEAYVNGPQTPEDVPVYEHSARLRDYFLLRATHAIMTCKKISAKSEDDVGRGYFIAAQVLNMTLPPSYRLKDDADVRLAMAYACLTRRELEQRIAAEFAQLEVTESSLPSVTLEERRDMNRIVNRFMKRRDARPDGPVAG